MKTSDKLQKEVFITLGEKGHSKLLLCLKSDEKAVRLAALSFFVDLFSNNEVLQTIFCEKFNFSPVGNVICLNWFPEGLKERQPVSRELINAVKNSTTVNNLHAAKFWHWPITAGEVDPLYHLVGLINPSFLVKK